MVVIVAELSYYADGSNFNHQGLLHAVLELVQTYLGKVEKSKGCETCFQKFWSQNQDLGLKLA